MRDVAEKGTSETVRHEQILTKSLYCKAYLYGINPRFLWNEF